MIKEIQLQVNFSRRFYNFTLLYPIHRYIIEIEKTAIKNNVLENEPHLALFFGHKNPLFFYKKIADLAKQHLTKTDFYFLKSTNI